MNFIIENNKPFADILKLKDFLLIENLVIPEYQRPYKWTAKNVLQLLDDIKLFSTKSSYRIGTIVMHHENSKMNIVDGQQRTISFLLIVKSIVKHHYLEDKIQNNELKSLIQLTRAKLFNPVFTNEVTKNNIKENYYEIERRIKSYEETFIDFFFNKCEITCFVLQNVSEAFQFFDSQNSRGIDLKPHDLLKAFHLREIDEKVDITNIVEEWENLESNELIKLFADFLYRVKGWSKGDSSRYFTKQEIHLFKGVNITTSKAYPFLNQLKYSDEYISNEANKKMVFPFQLDQVTINGKRFFEMIAHYKNKYKELVDENGKLRSIETLNNNSSIEIFNVINCYEGRNRTGDKYVQMLFKCAVLYYYDKFGQEELNLAIEIIFIWAFSIRLKKESLQLATVDNYVIKEENMFKKIRDSYRAQEIVNMALPVLKKGEILASKVDGITNLFSKMMYYAD